MKVWAMAVLSIGALALAGCGGSEQPAPAAGSGGRMEAPVDRSGDGHEQGAELKPQVNCPIMGGAVNRELYVDHEGKRIYVCCPPCLAAVRANPAAALEKLAELGEYAVDVPEG